MKSFRAVLAKRQSKYVKVLEWLDSRIEVLSIKEREICLGLRGVVRVDHQASSQDWTMACASEHVGTAVREFEWHQTSAMQKDETIPQLVSAFCYRDVQECGRGGLIIKVTWKASSDVTKNETTPEPILPTTVITIIQVVDEKKDLDFQRLRLFFSTENVKYMERGEKNQ